MPVPAAVEALIADAPLSAHVATCVDGRPHVAPVWYVYDDGVLRFLTSGRKLQNVEANPRVAISIEHADGPAVYWTATLLGTAGVIEDRATVDAVRRAIDEKYDNDETYAFQPMVEVTIGSATCEDYR